MTKEREIPSLPLEESGEIEDPDFFPIDRGGFFIDLVRFQKLDGHTKPRMVSGPFIWDDRLWHFRAYNMSQTRVNGDNWGFYRPIPDNDFIPLFLTNEYSEAESERVQVKFPDISSATADDEAPELSAYQDSVLSVIQLAKERNKL